MKKLITYILLSLMIMSLFTGCSMLDEGDEDTTVVATIDSFPESKEEALVGSKNYPAVATEGFTLDGYEGKIEYKVTGIYAGETCDNKLKEMGEDLENYFWDENCTHILYQVELKVDKLNNKTKKLTCSDIIFSEIYEMNKKTKIETPDFYNIGIVDNAKTDINQGKIGLKKSEEPVTLYQLVEMPEGTKEFYSKIYDKTGHSYWIYYSAEDM